MMDNPKAAASKMWDFGENNTVLDMDNANADVEMESKDSIDMQQDKTCEGQLKGLMKLSMLKLSNYT